MTVAAHNTIVLKKSHLSTRSKTTLGRKNARKYKMFYFLLLFNDLVKFIEKERSQNLQMSDFKISRK